MEAFINKLRGNGISLRGIYTEGVLKVRSIVRRVTNNRSYRDGLEKEDRQRLYLVIIMEARSIPPSVPTGGL